MRNIGTFDQANKALNKFVSKKPQTGPYTLGIMKKLMKHLKNPQNKLRVIHVAGTSGKTSTSYYVASLLHELGYKVGLTISPHIDNVNERAQINMSALPEKEYCHELGLFLDLVDKSRLEPSYFELLAAFAFWIFKKKKVDYAVVEVGLGGLLDATNVIKRKDKICVITDVGFDHTEILGDTLEKIAEQKAGIIQNKNMVFMNEQNKKVVYTVVRSCFGKGARLRLIDPNEKNSLNLSSLPLFQRRNYKLALAVVNYVKLYDTGLFLTKLQAESAINTYIPARMEELTYQRKTYILDGSHNEQKIGALITAIKRKFPDKKIAMLVSFGENKHPSVLASLKLLRELGGDIVLTSFNHGQDEIRLAIDPKELEKIAKGAGFTNIVVEPNPKLALKKLESLHSNICLITGSFYLLSHYRFLAKKSS